MTNINPVNKPKKIAEISLDSFVMYKLDESENFVFSPQPRDIKTKDGHTVITLGDVPLPLNVPHPQQGLTCLYGFRDALEVLQSHLQSAAMEGMRFIKVTFKLEVGEIVMGTTNNENLASTSFLNLRRLKDDLSNVIIDGVNAMLSEESARTKRKATFVKNMLEAGARPDILCQVIRDEPMFKHINAVVYMVPESTTDRRGRQVATIFTDKVVDLSFRGSMPFDIQLPKLS